jgi:RNA polymerase sigma-70 factor (ECF subfamily)
VGRHGFAADPDRFGPWLRTIVVRKARLACHSRRPAADVGLDDLPDSDDLPDNRLERLELAALIQQLVRELPPRLREAVCLFYFEGYDSGDAARFLEIPAGTFRRRLHEGRSRLRAAADLIKCR